MGLKYVFVWVMLEEFYLLFRADFNGPKLTNHIFLGGGDIIMNTNLSKKTFYSMEIKQSSKW